MLPVETFRCGSAFQVVPRPLGTAVGDPRTLAGWLLLLASVLLLYAVYERTVGITNVRLG